MKILHTRLSVTLLMLALASCGKQENRATPSAPDLAAGAQLLEAKPVEFLQGTVFASARQVTEAASGEIFVLDQDNHRLCVFDQQGRFQRQIGHLGQAAGEFFLPTAFAVRPDGEVFVLDGNNWRLQILDRSGKNQTTFRTSPKSLSIHVNHRGEIYLNYPSLGSLISVYDRKGRRQRGFGGLRSQSDAFPEYSSNDGDHQAFSRVLLSADGRGNVFAGYRFAPIVEKYDAKGRLLWEHRLEGQLARKLVADAWHRPFTLNNENIDGKQLAIILRSIAYNPSYDLTLLLMNRSGFSWIYIVDGRSGRHVGDIEFDTWPEGSPQAIAVVDDSIAVASRRRVDRLQLQAGALRQISQASSSSAMRGSR